MFGGIISRMGLVRAKGSRSLRIESTLRARPGNSVAVNGACLTVTPSTTRDQLAFDVSAETWRCTNLGELKIGDRVNLEPALRLGAPLGGHLISGHVDASAKIKAFHSLAGGFACLRVELPGELKGLVAPKGSISIDGISLTVSAVGRGSFEVALIPHTIKLTNLSQRRPGQYVNLEADLIARYVRSSLQAR